MTEYGLTLPVIRGKQGDRVFYLAMAANSVMNNFFPISMEPEHDRSQRQLNPKHARDIKEYIVNNLGDYLLGAITYSVDTEGMFRPVRGEDTDDLSPTIGDLTIPLSANLRSLDGQHRRAALKDAIDEEPSIAEDSTAVLIYVEDDLYKRKQMFSDMNATPKVVAKALNISFDSRDPFAKAAASLANDHPALRGHVEFESSRVKPSSTDFFTLAGVYDAIKRVKLGPTLPAGRSTRAFTEQELFDLGQEFFNLLMNARPELSEALNMTSEEMQSLREKTILFSSTTLRAIAGGLFGRMADDGETRMDKYIGALSKLDLDPRNPNSEFIRVGFLTPGKTTPNARNQEVLAATEVIKQALAR